MSDQHTPEPWRLGRFNGYESYEEVREMVGNMDVVVDTATGPYVLAACNINFPGDARANARRIVACVNACAGIPTEELEQFDGGIGKGGLVAERAFAEAAKVEQQRETAWAELREIREAIGANQEESTADEVRRFVAQRDELLVAARNLRDVKGRNHTEQAMNRLIQIIAKCESA